jgi:hypothetical protein
VTAARSASTEAATQHRRITALRTCGYRRTWCLPAGAAAGWHRMGVRTLIIAAALTWAVRQIVQDVYVDGA